MRSETPIACSLTDDELRARRSGILAELSRAVVHAEKLQDGLILRFDADGGMLSLIAEAVELERQCCPFLRFRITVESDSGPLRLEISGPPGTGDFIADLLP